MRPNRCETHSGMVGIDHCCACAEGQIDDLRRALVQLRVAVRRVHGAIRVTLGGRP